MRSPAQLAAKSERPAADAKALNGYKRFVDRIHREQKSLERHSAKQRRLPELAEDNGGGALQAGKADHGISNVVLYKLAVCDAEPLAAGGLNAEALQEISRHGTERRAGVHDGLDVLEARGGQVPDLKADAKGSHLDHPKDTPESSGVGVLPHKNGRGCGQDTRVKGPGVHQQAPSAGNEPIE